MIALLVLLPIFSFAVTPEELRKSVIENFPLIEEAHMKKKSADAGITAAEGAFDHKLKFKSFKRFEDKYDNSYFETTIERDTGLRGLTLLAGHRQGSGLFPPYDGKFDTSSVGEIYAGVSLPLLRDSSTDEGRTNLALAKFEKAQAQEELNLKKNIYIHKALSLYYKWIAEERILRINKEIFDLALQREEMLQQKFKRGDVEKVKLTDNERTIEKRRAEILKSEAKLRMIEAELALFLPDTTTVAKFTDKELHAIKKVSFPSELPVDTLPQFKILKLEKEKIEATEKLAEQTRLPGLQVDVIGARELSSGIPYDPDRLQVGVRFDYPLENRKARGKTVQQSYKRRAIDQRLIYSERELRLSYLNALRIIDLSLRRFEATTDEAEKTRVMARAEGTRFRAGGSDLFVVNLREIDVTDAEIRKWTSWYEFHQAVLDARLYRADI